MEGVHRQRSSNGSPNAPPRGRGSWMWRVHTRCPHRALRSCELCALAAVYLRKQLQDREELAAERLDPYFSRSRAAFHTCRFAQRDWRTIARNAACLSFSQSLDAAGAFRASSMELGRKAVYYLTTKASSYSRLHCRHPAAQDRTSRAALQGLWVFASLLGRLRSRFTTPARCSWARRRAPPRQFNTAPTSAAKSDFGNSRLLHACVTVIGPCTRE